MQGSEDGQLSLLEALVRAGQRFIRKLRGSPEASGAWAARAMGLGAGFLVVGMAWVGLRALRRRAARTATEPGWAMLGPERRLYRELLGLLAHRGYPKPGWLPPMQHLRTVAERDMALAGAAGEVVAHLYRSRFGGGSGDDLAAANRKLQEITRDAGGGQATR